MTEHLPIQRWTKIFTRYPASELLPNENGEYVTYDDHLDALAAARARGEFETYALGLKLGRAAGIKDGLGAARDAVAALDHAPRCELVWGCECSESHPLECTCNRDDAIAAIDALREKQ